MMLIRCFGFNGYCVGYLISMVSVDYSWLALIDEHTSGILILERKSTFGN